MPDYTKGGVTYNITQYDGGTNEATIIALGTTATRHGVGNIQNVGFETLLVQSPTGAKYAKRGDYISKRAVTGALEVLPQNQGLGDYTIVP